MMGKIADEHKTAHDQNKTEDRGQLREQHSGAMYACAILALLIWARERHDALLRFFLLLRCFVGIRCCRGHRDLLSIGGQHALPHALQGRSMLTTLYPVDTL